MKLICIDIGNTSISYSYYINKKVILPIQRLECNMNSIQMLIEIIDKLLKKEKYTVIISSVVPSLSNIFFSNLKSKYISFFEITHLNSIVNLKVEDPREVGADRICNVCATKSIYGNPSITIDFGTATTFDVINNNGDFIGGAIAPGIDISADYLINKTELLKKIVYKFPNSIIGKNTIENIQSGVMYGGLYSIEGMINSIINSMNFKNPNIILTGGFGSLIEDKLLIKHEYEEALTILGMVEIYKENFNH